MSIVTTATGQLVMHPVVSKSLKIWATTLGRDKVRQTSVAGVLSQVFIVAPQQMYRAIQYFARFYAYFLLTRGHKEQAQRWAALKNHLGLGRKCMPAFVLFITLSNETS
jgi:peroxin-11B